MEPYELENLRAARPGGFQKRVRHKLESRTGNSVEEIDVY